MSSPAETVTGDPGRDRPLPVGHDDVLPPPAPPYLSTAAAVVLAGLSLLAFISHYLILFAVAGVVATAIALWRCRDRPGLVWMPRLAILGGALSTLMIGVTVSHALSRQVHVVGTATQFADEWVELIREGRDREAHQLMLPVASRVKPGQTLDEFYPEIEPPAEGLSEAETETYWGKVEMHPTTRLKEFRREPLTQMLLTNPDSIRAERTGEVQFFPDDNEDTVVVRYRLTVLNGDRAVRELLADVSLKRAVRPDLGVATWQVMSVRKPEEK